MDYQFKRLLNLVRRTGDRLVVTDPNGEDAYVLMGLDAYEKLADILTPPDVGFSDDFNCGDEFDKYDFDDDDDEEDAEIELPGGRVVAQAHLEPGDHHRAQDGTEEEVAENGNVLRPAGIVERLERAAAVSSLAELLHNEPGLIKYLSPKDYAS